MYYVVLWKISHCGGELARQRFYGNQCNKFSNLYATLLVVRDRERESDRWIRKKKYGQKSYGVFFVFLYWKHCSNFSPLDYVSDSIIYYFYDHINCSSDIEIVFFSIWLLIQVLSLLNLNVKLWILFQKVSKRMNNFNFSFQWLVIPLKTHLRNQGNR